MIWIEPIYDRSQADIDLLISLNSKINLVGWNGLTVLEKANWLYGQGEELYGNEDSLYTVDDLIITVSSSYVRGAIHHYDLNRIENNCLFLKEKMESYGYLCTVNVKLDWVIDDFLRLDDINRIKQNVLNLVECYYSLPDSPIISLVPTKLDFTQVNGIEKMIFDLETILNRMIDSFLYCGTFYSGQEIVL